MSCLSFEGGQASYAYLSLARLIYHICQKHPVCLLGNKNTQQCNVSKTQTLKKEEKDI